MHETFAALKLAIIQKLEMSKVRNVPVLHSHPLPTLRESLPTSLLLFIISRHEQSSWSINVECHLLKADHKSIFCR